jgi:hypothetical protein
MKHRRRTLSDAFASAPDAACVVDSFESERGAAAADHGPQRRGILVRVTPELRRRLKLAALIRGTTVQALLLEAITEVLKAPDRPPMP